MGNKPVKTVLIDIDEDDLEHPWYEVFIGEIINSKELIRCKDCEYYNKKYGVCTKKFMLLPVEKNDYCSDAKRKEGDE